jgi:DNA-binding IscR family transcriptional regulator
VKDYGPGRECTGCGSILRRSNPGPLCNPCEDNGELRRHEEEIVKGEDRKAAVLAYLEEHDGWVKGPEICAALGIPRGSIGGIVVGLLNDGIVLSRPPQQGGGYRLAVAASQTEDADCDTAPEAEAGISAECDDTSGIGSCRQEEEQEAAALSESSEFEYVAEKGATDDH